MIVLSYFHFLFSYIIRHTTSVVSLVGTKMANNSYMGEICKEIYFMFGRIL